MENIKIGDTVTLQSPFDSKRQYTVLEINGNYVTLHLAGQRKNLVIYIKCIKGKQ
ncbi:hypothetical protein ABDK00_007580 [Niabella insulamsoli]|uniref:hypothetical protein n=1 Tax=Niabella insulamsoli TaxID=3144874 RepID=UPI00035DD647